mgnify:CR=1 FL=1
MIFFRPYKKSDAKYLISWVKDEVTFSNWCSNLFQYPLTPQQLDIYYHYYDTTTNGFPITAVDQSGTPVGHILIKDVAYTKSAYFSFVLLDPQKRKQGIGKEMISTAIMYVSQLLQCQKITLKVFENNLSARKCYLSAGFQDIAYEKEVFAFHEQLWGCYTMEWKKHGKG